MNSPSLTLRFTSVSDLVFAPTYWNESLSTSIISFPL